MGEGVAAMGWLPDRLNLSIGNSCWVRCRGCYSAFGRTPPDLARVESSVANFVRCGIRAVTVSGGDPLRISGLLPFLRQLRRAGIKSIKVDTVGTALLPGQADRVELEELLDAVDILGIPLDGWSQESVAWFREGRARLFAETLEVIAAIDGADRDCDLYVNTVLHRQNVAGADKMFEIVERFAGVQRWNVFQYVPTDQAMGDANVQLALSDVSFRSAANLIAACAAGKRRFEIECASARDRLGKYLLVNSDGDSWMPDSDGRTVPLGNVFGRERATVDAWRDVAERLTSPVRKR